MTARTTDQAMAALEAVELSLKKARDIVEKQVPPKIGENLWQAMRLGRAAPAVADEYGGSLVHSLSRLRDDLDSLLKEVGTAQHIVAAAVHKTPDMKYLVL